MGIFPGYRHDEEDETKRAKPTKPRSLYPRWMDRAEGPNFRPANLKQLEYAFDLAMERLKKDAAPHLDAKERKQIMPIG